MPKIIEGPLTGNNLKIGIIIGRFNEFITSKLKEGAIDCLLRHGVMEQNITLALVPGAFEIPLMAKKMAKTDSYHALICLGTVIRGATSHYDYVCNESAKGISKVSLDLEVPVINGILTTNSLEQAIERAGTKSGNKGREAALAAIEMGNLMNANEF